MVGEPEQLGFRPRPSGDVECAREAQGFSQDFCRAGRNQEGARAVGAGRGLDDRDRRRCICVERNLRGRGVGEDEPTVRAGDPHADREQIDHGMEQIEPPLGLVPRRGLIGRTRQHACVTRVRVWFESRHVPCSRTP